MSLPRIVATLAASLLLASSAIAAPTTAFKVDVTGNASGTPMILIPGLSSAGAVWDGTVKRYCGARRCHVLTLAGFAGVPAIDAPLLATAEQQLSEYIAANKLQQPVIVGHSLGGFLGLKLAADHPDQVGRLVIVDSLPALAAIQMPSITGPQMKEMAAGMRTRMLGMDAATYKAGQLQTLRTMITGEADVQRALVWGQQSDRTTVANAMADLMAQDLRQEVARIKAPTLVMGTWIAYKNFGTRDQFLQGYQDQYRQLPGVKIELADNARHFIMLDDPDWMYDRIDQFLK
ncbi:pimeloyl-ACP methyl ester carboxylesterase [Duganella sp. 3397]|uniref:alpha/beta fold hydrolase n=1 Tax=Duganella sp. 3397 TaxID=2817732 RepID=UPI0028607F5C|nr:alpha/beta hydrolase [Duganella sp. 3397]MDR7052139.1 pimeloyl-ACP methyl ester carboxylesterase [Duganella sp. 3397]